MKTGGLDWIFSFQMDKLSDYSFDFVNTLVKEFEDLRTDIRQIKHSNLMLEIKMRQHDKKIEELERSRARGKSRSPNLWNLFKAEMQGCYSPEEEPNKYIEWKDSILHSKDSRIEMYRDLIKSKFRSWTWSDIEAYDKKLAETYNVEPIDLGEEK